MSTLRGRFSLILAFLLALPFLYASPAHASDMYLDMAIHHGMAVTHTLSGDIMANATKRRAELARGVNTPAPKENWPAGVNERNVSQHVFSVQELRAMGSADLDRKRALLTNREITVQGVVHRLPNSDRMFALIIPGQDYYKVFASWHVGRHTTAKPNLPRAGETVRLRGKVSKLYSRHDITLDKPQILSAGRMEPARPSQTSTASETARGAEAASRSAAARTTTAPNPSKLRFTPSAAVTREVNARLTQALTASLHQGQRPEELRRILDSGDLHRGFKRIVNPYGLSENDLGDVFAASMIISWQIIHESEGDNRKAVEAVRKGMRDAMSRVAWIDQLNDEQKQTLAETIIVGTMINIDRYNTGKHQRNREAISIAKQDAGTMMRAFSGIELQHYQLTDNGFQRR